MSLIFGLDIGTTSVGFSVVKWGEEQRIPDHGMGVRIFSEGVTEKEREPRNKARREARLIRRQIRRRRYRRKELGQILKEVGLLPSFGTEEWDKVMGCDPWFLRDEGMGKPLAPHEIGRIIYHLVKRRGFSSPRMLDGDEGEDEESGKVKEAIGALRREMNGRTIGQTLAGEEKKRNRYIGRDMVEDEFNRLWQAQAAHHPNLLTEDLRRKIHSIAFFQRPIYWRLDTLGSCRFVPDSPLCGKGAWNAQRFVMLQSLNSLRLSSGNQRPLDEKERKAALQLLDTQRSTTFSALRKQLGLNKTEKFNFEMGGLKELKGNATEAALIGVFKKSGGASWEEIAEETRSGLRGEIFERLHQVYYRRVGNHREEIRNPEEVKQLKGNLAQDIAARYRLSPEQASGLSELTLPSGWLSLSREAVERLLPHLEEGQRYDQAVEAAFGRSHSQAEQTGELLDRLPSSPKDMPDVRNPTVNRALNEVRKVVNNLIAVHGRPDAIRVELARDLRLSKTKRAEIDKNNRDRETQRKKAAKELESNGIANPARRDIEKWLLWKESGEYCPYSGLKIGFDQLFRTGEFDVEHIVPRSRSLDNGFGNKTLCKKEINIAKGNRTPFEFFHGTPEEWERVKDLAKCLPPSKYRRFVRTDWMGAEADDFAERQLRDTAYIAVAARDFLAKLGPDVTVQTCNGRVTAQLRDMWGLNTILGDSGVKVRSDHRHHAIDALAVALATPAMVKRLSDYHAKKETLPGERPEFPEPWPHFHADVTRSIEAIVVSHKVRRKVSGPLHKQTNYGDTGETVTEKGTTYSLFVSRKPLQGITASQIETIRDENVKAIVKAHVVAQGGDSKKAFPPYPRLPGPDGSQGPEIRKVRVLTKQQRGLMVPLNARTRAWADGGNNHHLAIYRLADGKIHYEIVSLLEATGRLGRGESVVDRKGPEGSRFIMSLGPGDVVEFPPKDDGMPQYRIVTSVWAAGQIVLEDHRSADGAVWKRPTAASLLKDGGRKVAVDPIGRIRPAHD